MSETKNNECDAEKEWGGIMRKCFKPAGHKEMHGTSHEAMLIDHVSGDYKGTITF